MRLLRAGTAARSFRRRGDRLPIAAGGLAALALAIDGLATNGQYSGFAPLDGTGVSIGNAAEFDSVRWVNPADDTVLATTAAAPDLSVLDTGDPTAPGLVRVEGLTGGSVVATRLVPVRAALPVAAGTIADLDLTFTGTAVLGHVADVATLFTGPAATFEADGYAGVSLTGNRLDVDPSVETAGTTARVRAITSGGTAEITFTVVAEELAFAAAPSFSLTEVSDDTALQFSANRAGATLEARFVVDGIEVQARSTDLTYVFVEADGGDPVTATAFITLDGVEISDTATLAGVGWKVPVAAGALNPADAVAGQAITPIDVLADFTLAGDADKSALTVTMTTSPAWASFDGQFVTGTPPAEATGVVFAFEAANPEAETATTGFSIDVTAAAPLTIDSLTFNDTSDGTADQLDMTYSGSPTGGWLVTSTSATAPGAADIKTGAGTGSLEGTTFSPGAAVDLTGLTDASEPATHVHVLLEDGDTNQAIETVAVSGLDFTSPVFSAAEVGAIDDTSLIVTIDSALYGATAAADWDVQVDGAPATESAVAFTEGTADIDITLGAAVAAGQTVTVAYTGTGLTDADGNPLGSFTAQPVTNNLGGGGALGSLLATQNSTVNLTSGLNETLAFQAPTGVSYLIIAGAGSGNMNYSVTGPNLTSVRPVAWGFSTHVRVFRIDATAASDIVVAGSNGNSSSRRIYHLIDGNGVAPTGSEAHANDTSSPYSNSVAKAAGDLIVVLGFAANSDNTGITISGELTNTDIVSEVLWAHGETDPRNDYVAVATGVAAAGGTASYTITFADGVLGDVQTVIMKFPV